jgi:hypothetical protein
MLRNWETGLGVQGQIDFSPYNIAFTAEGRRRVHAFSYILALLTPPVRGVLSRPKIIWGARCAQFGETPITQGDPMCPVWGDLDSSGRPDVPSLGRPRYLGGDPDNLGDRCAQFGETDSQ